MKPPTHPPISLSYTQKHKLSPNVLAMVHASNDLAMVVPSEILAETTPQGMAKVISVFIKVIYINFQVQTVGLQLLMLH